MFSCTDRAPGGPRSAVVPWPRMGEPDQAPPRPSARRLGWAAVLFFTVKGLLWLALGAGAWRVAFD